MPHKFNANESVYMSLDFSTICFMDLHGPFYTKTKPFRRLPFVGVLYMVSSYIAFFQNFVVFEILVNLL